MEAPGGQAVKGRKQTLTLTYSIGRNRPTRLNSIMKKQRIIFLFTALCLSFLVFTTATDIEAAQQSTNQLRSHLRQGIEKSFNLEIESADTYLRKAVELDRENPMGYAFLAMAHLLSYETSFEQMDRERIQEIMLRYVRETVARAEKRIEEYPKDGQAYFAMALVKIVKVRWAISQKHYFMIAQETLKIWHYLEKAKEGDPQNYDIYFPMGFLHYHLDHLSALGRFFSSIFIVSGDSQKGLRELELTAEKGDLLKELAKAELVSVYTSFEKQPARALTIARELREKYPRNYNCSFGLANTLSDLNRFDEAFAIAREIEKGIQAGIPPFVPQLQPRYDQLMGRILFNQRQYDRAAEYFQKVLKNSASYNARVRAWAWVNLGMIHDANKERNKAEECYSRALKLEDGEGIAQIEARKYLKTPYVPSPIP
jgi:tetratricopeptide (TPR) repeat protein